MRLATSDEANTIEPPLADWGPLLVRNASQRQLLPDVMRGVSRGLLRNELLAEAESYTISLCKKAQARGFTVPTPDSSTEVSPPVLMTGHQPVVYHAGLLLKEELLNSCAAENAATAISVTIDTDEGTSGEITWPSQQGTSILYKHASLVGSAEGILGRQRVVSASEVQKIFGEMLDDLRASGLSHMSESVIRASRVYEAFAGEPIPEAHSVLRRVSRGHSHLEIPLSRLSMLPEAKRFFEQIISHGASFVRLYNSSLDSYRAAHKIKNAANPFPNMKDDSEGVELPLWILGAKGRRPLLLRQGAPPELSTDEVIIPRGSIVTLLLRGFCSDLFIHGLGGGRYDHFIDEFGDAYLGSPLPSFVVASRTRFVFPGRVQALKDLLLLKSQIKDMVTHPEKFIGQDLFSGDEERVLLESQKTRESLLAALREASPSERRPITYQLNDLNHSVRRFLEQTAIYQRLHASDCNEATLAHLSNRELPFFLE